MPGFLLHQGATVSCAHAAQAQPTQTHPRVLVAGQPVVTQPAPYSVAGCSFKVPPGVPFPCTTAMWNTKAARVFVEKKPVLLQDSQAICTPTGTPLTISATQRRVQGT